MEASQIKGSFATVFNSYGNYLDYFKQQPLIAKPFSQKSLS